MSREEIELQHLHAEHQRVEAERLKIQLECDEIRKRIGEKWYSGKFLIQGTVGGIVASALLATWFVGYFQPILRKQQEIDSLETKRLSAELSLREQELKQQQAESKRATDALTVEREKAKIELESLIAQNRDLQNAQKSTQELAVNLQNALEGTQKRLTALGTEKTISEQERERLDATVRSARVRVEELSGEIQKLQAARTETISRTAQLDEQLKTREIAGKDVNIIFTEKNRQIAMAVKSLLDGFGASVILKPTSDSGNAPHIGKLYYYSTAQLEAAKQIAEQVSKLQSVIPTEGSIGQGPLNLWLVR